jgi:hypothetical protein
MTDSTALTTVINQSQAVQPLTADLSQVAPLGVRISKAAMAVRAVEERGKVSGRINYTYARASDVKLAVRRILADNGIAVIPMIRHVEQRKEGNMTITRCHLSFVLSCEQGAIEVPWVADSQDIGDKGISKAVTTGLKYFLINLLQIPTGVEEDSDTDETQRDTSPTTNDNGRTEPPVVKDMAWAASLRTSQGTLFSKLDREQLTIALGHTKPDSDKHTAIQMLLDALDNPTAEYPNETIAAVIEAGLTKNVYSAKNTLVKAKEIHPNDAADIVVEWFGHYRTARGQELSSDDAAGYADEQMNEVPFD